MDILRSGIVDKIGQLVLPRLNKLLIPEIASSRHAEAEINARIQALKIPATDKVDARDAAATATAPDAVVT